jgi:hypothetical protein
MSFVTILLSLFIFASSVPTHAMYKEAPRRPRCSFRDALKLCIAVSVGCICATMGLNAHHTIVEQTKADYEKRIADREKQIAELKNALFDYEYPCLEISIISSAFNQYKSNTIKMDPPFCGKTIDAKKLKKLEDTLKEKFGADTRVVVNRAPCKFLPLLLMVFIQNHLILVPMIFIKRLKC